MKKIISTGNKNFEIGKRTYVMGNLNVAYDNFSRERKASDIAKVLSNAKQMIEDGVDIINLGEDYIKLENEEITESRELNEVIPLVQAVCSEVNVPVSISTYRANVAEEAIKAGAVFVNDVWGLKKDPRMSKVIAKYNVPCCLVHNRQNKNYESLMKDIYKDLKESVDIALSAGIKEENIILDPGIGVSKTSEQSLIVMHHLGYLTTLGYPLLLGIYNGFSMGKDMEAVKEVEIEDTVTTTVIGIMKGYDFVRVDDVRKNKKACLITDAVMRM